MKSETITKQICKTVEITTYTAYDGTVFEDDDECIKHEQELLNKDNIISLWNGDKKLIKFNNKDELKAYQDICKYFNFYLPEIVLCDRTVDFNDYVNFFTDKFPFYFLSPDDERCFYKINQASFNMLAEYKRR